MNKKNEFNSYTTSFAIHVACEYVPDYMKDRLQLLEKEHRAAEGELSPTEKAGRRNALLRTLAANIRRDGESLTSVAKRIEKLMHSPRNGRSLTTNETLAVEQILKLNNGKPLKFRRIFDLIS